jgi:hypothetical protein
MFKKKKVFLIYTVMTGYSDMLKKDYRFDHSDCLLDKFGLVVLIGPKSGSEALHTLNNYRFLYCTAHKVH